MQETNDIEHETGDSQDAKQGSNWVIMPPSRMRSHESSTGSILSTKAVYSGFIFRGLAQFLQKNNRFRLMSLPK